MSPPPSTERILIVGSGGIGGVLACHLLEAGITPWLATTNERVRQAWLSGEAQLDGRRLGRRVAADHVIDSARGHGPFDVVFVAVQPPQIDDVVASLAGALADRGRVVCLSNGLCEERIARALGPDRVIGAVVAWGARMPEPGDFVQTAPGGFRVGAFDGSSGPELDRVCELLSSVGRVKRTDNLRGARFSKLALNCAVSTLGAISGQTLGELLLQRPARSLALAILREATQIARAEGIRLEPVTRLNLEWLSEPRSAVGSAAQHALLLGVGLRYRRMRSSTVAARERGRAPAVDYLNGELTERGERFGVPTPINQAARALVWEIAAGQRQAGAAALESLARVLRQQPRGAT
ncbi:MAG TPA: 2-dehydropantoate 2-reductase N-terminal domain-containing protein [Polyangiaceae bacterium]|nr:2-dehydropantoate 2-reductase N-terminal domain-containing protein [Polyangiaceae bacterium]